MQVQSRRNTLVNNCILLGRLFWVSSPAYQTFCISFFKIKPFSAQFSPTSRKLHGCFTTICGFIYRRCSDNIFQAPLGPRPTNFYLMSLGTFENLTNSYGRDIKPKERLIKSTMNFSEVRFDRILLHLVKPTLITSTLGLFNNHLSSNFPSDAPHLIPKIILLKRRKTSLELSPDRYTHSCGGFFNTE